MSNKAVIHSNAAPQALGPYSQAVKVSNTVYLSGQIPLDPETMALVAGDPDTQARQVFANLAAVAEAAGGTLGDFVKLTVYLLDLADFAAVNAVMEELFAEPYPARVCIQAAALPKDARIEVDAIMAR
jgi:reactive intermediate/imine deaminase